AGSRIRFPVFDDHVVGDAELEGHAEPLRVRQARADRGPDQHGEPEREQPVHGRLRDPRVAPDERLHETRSLGALEVDAVVGSDVVTSSRGSWGRAVSSWRYM